MLVLSRKKDEAIRIGDEITIKVIALKGGGVRLGIDAPINISIVRSELLPGFEGSAGTVARNGGAATAENSDRKLSYAEGN
jgi:carbon storage regulator